MEIFNFITFKYFDSNIKPDTRPGTGAETTNGKNLVIKGV